jgi:predicted nuclease with RNAse H fold
MTHEAGASATLRAMEKHSNHVNVHSAGGRALIVAGIDLASDPARTGVALLRVDPTGGTVDPKALAGSDEALVGLSELADAVGVDAPLGWPAPYVEAIARHHAAKGWPETRDPVEQRRLLCRRETDRVVMAETRLVPLSVAADRIGVVAMRAARLQQLWSNALDVPLPRDGSGWLVEAYPAAALRRWQLPHRGYKELSGATVRAGLVDELLEAAPWLSVDHPARLQGSDHYLDALVSALVALAAKVGHTLAPGPGQVALARREGWIHLPTSSLAELFEAVKLRLNPA